MNDSTDRANRIREEEQPAKRHPFSYRLRSLLIGTGWTCVVLGYLVHPYQVEKRAEARLRTLAGGPMKGLPVVISYCKPRGIEGDYEILKEIRRSYSSARDADLRMLRDIPRIGMLHLSNTNISDRGMQIVAELDELRHLWLDHTRISDAGIVHLGQLTQLQTLSLNDTFISDQIINELRRLPRLKAVELCQTNLTADGCLALQAAIPDCVIIH